jgi:hypothetical protein
MINKIVAGYIAPKGITPIYNQLILEGLEVKIKLVYKVDIVFCGVPVEYQCCIKLPIFQ